MESVSVRVIPPEMERLTHRERELIGSWSRQFFGSHPLTTRFAWVRTEGVRFRVLVYSGEELVSYLRIIERNAHLDGRKYTYWWTWYCHDFARTSKKRFFKHGFA